MKNRTAIFIVLIFISLFLLAFSPFEKEAKESVEGRKKYAVGEMAEAENEFAEAAKRLENNAEAYYDLGNALQSQQKYEDALNAYKKSLETGKTTANPPDRARRNFRRKKSAVRTGKRRSSEIPRLPAL